MYLCNLIIQINTFSVSAMLSVSVSFLSYFYPNRSKQLGALQMFGSAWGFFPPGEFFPATLVSCLLSWFPLLIIQSILWCLWVWFSALARKADWLFDVLWIHIIRILTDGIQFKYNEGGLLVAATQDISFVSLCISMYADDLSLFFFPCENRVLGQHFLKYQCWQILCVLLQEPRSVHAEKTFT